MNQTSDLETLINRDIARSIARKLALEAPGLHHAKVTCGRGGCKVELRPRDAVRLDEVRMAMRRIFGPNVLGTTITVVPERICRVHEDCVAHPKIGRACWEASGER